MKKISKQGFVCAITLLSTITATITFAGNSNRYKTQSGGTVLDTKMNLIWKRCSEGQKWNGKTCQGNTKMMRWYAATAYAKNHKFAGSSNWRLPTIKELNTLIYCSNGKKLKYKQDGFNGKNVEGGYGCSSSIHGKFQKPTIDIKIFPNTSSYSFWSSSPNSDFSSSMFRLNFVNGSDGRNAHNNNFYVRLVRSKE
ncbi:MAG: hypothetical protein DRQ51_05570 [Gammaproteobacteria bacterium]|nr:MAG: hypothetical protein DRQ51_05570 [Gammaproteobacteria bacterium]